MSNDANGNIGGLQDDGVAVIGVIVNLEGGVSLGICTICRLRVWHGSHTADNGRIAVEPNRGCGHVFHQACLRGWFNHLGGSQLACPMCRGACTGVIVRID